MNIEGLNELRQTLSNQCSKFASTIEEKNAIELSDDEERLLKEYRAFVARSEPGKTFSWKTPK